MLAHGAVLRSQFFSAEQLKAIVLDYRNAGLDPVEVAVMELAQKVVLQANSVTSADIEGLRAHGLADDEILDVVLAAAARSFFSNALDALGAEPDQRLLGIEDSLRDVLMVGRSFSTPAQNE